MHPVVSSMRVEVVCATSASMSDWSGQGYADDVARLYWVEKGRASVHHHGRTFSLRPGVLHLIPAGTAFDFKCAGTFLQHWIHFRALAFGGLDVLRYLGCAFESRYSDARRIAETFARLEVIAHSDGPPAAVEAHGLLMLLMAPFFEQAGSRNTEGDSGLWRFRGVLTFIEEHLADELRVSALADMAHLERTYFARAFRKQFGVSPVTFIQQRRLDRAKRLLLETDQKLYAIADATGYCDVYHFSRSLKQSTGIPPGVFRRDAVRSP
jgi:AraC-like DNA-binding protein